jgi:hypothetical protein
LAVWEAIYPNVLRKMYSGYMDKRVWRDSPSLFVERDGGLKIK